ncbi:7716_t:CDS:2 [Dentiscutata heterogama]|uniref:7716_t:CDS:1 n=1 Tax=Dentiscutata heterogama TaxID=1316150 RepID=A0ACA9LD93_9GLOM|nr:7716_t:CDS:2 [Dentiscutata heterogama]
MHLLVLQSLIDFANANEIDLNSPRIITDFEIAAINTTQYVFSEVINKACFFYLGQNRWKKIQKCELATFLPPGEISNAFNILKLQILEEAKELVL